MSQHRTLALVSALALVLGCDASDGGPAPFEPSRIVRLTYEAKGTNGLPALSGTLEFPSVHEDGQLVEGEEFHGIWTISWVPGANTEQPVGPQVGTGSFAGVVGPGGIVSIGLNPELADNNVDLRATANGSRLSGTWTWSTLTGTQSEGEFRAAEGQ